MTGWPKAEVGVALLEPNADGESEDSEPPEPKIDAAPEVEDVGLAPKAVEPPPPNAAKPPVLFPLLPNAAPVLAVGGLPKADVAPPKGEGEGDEPNAVDCPKADGAGDVDF